MSATTFAGVRIKQEPGSHHNLSAAGSVCYVCSGPGADYPLQSRPRERGPYFPFLETHIPPQGAERPTSEGAVLACPVCYSFLTQQWEAHEQNRTPRGKRMYWLKRTDNGPYAGIEPGMQPQEDPAAGGCSPERLTSSSPPALPAAALDLSVPTPTPAPAAATPTVPPATAAGDICYVCGAASKSAPLANVFAKPIANCPFFPSLSSHPMPLGSRPMDSSGRVQACESCHRSLLEQWDTYQRHAVPHPERRYQLPTPRTFVCFTCGLEFPFSAQRAVSAVATSDQTGFPFLRTLAPPPGAQPLSPAGVALVCSMCFKSLQRQLRVFEISNVPEAKRNFKVLHEAPLPVTPSASATSSVLRKQLLSPQTKYLGCYLCEKIGPLESLHPCETAPPGPHFPFLRDVARPIAARPMDSQGRVLLCTDCRDDLQRQWDAFEGAGLPLNQRRYHASSAMAPAATSGTSSATSQQQTTGSQVVLCFVCGEQTAETFPVASRDSGGPFFPFLESHQPGVDAAGGAAVCTFCFHSLMAQWLAYESSPHAEDAVRMSRRYNTHHYVCYICGITTYRRRVRTLTVRDFPFLREHPRPAGALTLRDGVVSCLTCSESLSSQWKDYERMRVPVEMRKYNWIVLPPPPEETRVCTVFPLFLM